MIETIRISFLRTIVPLIAGTIITVLARANITGLDDVAVELVTIVVTAVFYAVVRVLEEKAGPGWGWLLGYAKVPDYAKNTSAE